MFGASFEKLLTVLDPDREIAGQRYIELCFKLRKVFGRGYCRESDIEELIDTTIDRVAKRLGDGEVVENVNTYCFGVARKVLLEYARKRPHEPLRPDQPDGPLIEDHDEEERRYKCLEKCLAELTQENRQLIVDYYDEGENEKNKDHRKRLAERFGKSSGALKVHATRLRETLRKCVAACLKEAQV